MSPDMQVDTDSGSLLPNVYFRINNVLSGAVSALLACVAGKSYS